MGSDDGASDKGVESNVWEKAFSDKYYTRHVLAKCLKNMTDGEARIIGMVKYTNVDSTNRFHLTEAIRQLKDADRCAWKLVRAYDKNT